jgi:hypothetical protein
MTDIPPIVGETEEQAAEALRDAQAAAAPGRRLRVTRASQVTMRRIRWLWNGRVVLGGLTLLAGREGLGKSTVSVDLAAQVTRGDLDGEFRGQPRNVVLVHSEDARDYTIVPRLVAAGADLDRVLFVDAITRHDDGETFESNPVLPLDVALLADLVTESDAALVILDAATSVIDSRLDGDRDRQMRQGLESIARGIGERTGAAVLGVVHFGKRESSDTGKLILGSIAWSQVARSVVAVARDDDSGDLVVSVSKGNLGSGAPSLGARVVSAVVPTPEGAADVGRIEWLGEVDQNATELLGSGQRDEDRHERDAATDWLRDYLTETDRAPSKEVKKAARDAGFSERTLQRARAALKIAVTPEGFPRQSYWSLPNRSDATSDVGARGGGTTGMTGTTGPDLQRSDANGSPLRSVVPVVPVNTRGTTDGTTGQEARSVCLGCGREVPVGADACAACYRAGRVA